MPDPVRLLWALVALAVVGPGLLCLASGLIPLMIVGTVCLVVLAAVRHYIGHR
jgi:hypothetical protein